MMPEPQPGTKPTSRGEERRVTICAGFSSMYGVVLCADSQETVGVMKFDAPKLVIMPEIGSRTDAVRMTFAGAGNGPFIDKLVSKMWEAAVRGPEMSHAEVLERIEDAIIDCHQKIWGVYGKVGERPEAEIIFALYAENRVKLYKATGPIVSPPVESHVFAGIGGELGAFLAEHLRGGGDSLQGDVGIGSYIIENAKRYVDGCGGDTQIAALMIDGSIQTMNAWDTRKMADTIFSIGRGIYYLFSSAVDMGETKKSLDEIGKGVVKEIHSSRGQLRKEIRKFIRIRPSLMKKFKAMYRKIEWPSLTASSGSHTSVDQP